MINPSREDAWHLLTEWTPGEALRRHGLAVEAAVAWYGANRFGVAGSELETWRIAGLLHDFDGHGDHTGVPRTSLLARTVYACDELSGFIIAVAYVRPNRSLDEVDPHAVVKKMKDKGFARQVPRDQLLRGAEELGVPFEEHVANVVAGLKTVREILGL